MGSNPTPSVESSPGRARGQARSDDRPVRTHPDSRSEDGPWVRAERPSRSSRSGRPVKPRRGSRSEPIPLPVGDGEQAEPIPPLWRDGERSELVRRSLGRANSPRPYLDGWPSGLRRTIGNRVDIVRVGSNPTPSVDFVQSRCGFEPTRTAHAGRSVGLLRRRPQLHPTPSVVVTRVVRGVAQSGRALRSGRRGPRFESGRPD